MSENDASWKTWLAFASEDLRSADDTIPHGHHALACFLSQQCAEKALKAVYIYLGLEHPRTHNLIAMVNALIRHYPQLEIFRESLTMLDGYYGTTRYPNGMALSEKPAFYTEKDSAIAVTAARDFFEFVTKILVEEV